jgi:hypothetical protein
MLTPAHIAASYLLSQTPGLLHITLGTNEVLAIVVAGNVVDLDFIWGIINKKSGDDHHNFITHTPIFTVSIWLLVFLVFNNMFSFMAWTLILLSGLLHLFLDDIGYWFCRFGWQQISKYHQINWLYPFKSFPKRKYLGSTKQLLRDYLTKAKVNISLELLLLALGVVVFLSLR